MISRLTLRVRLFLFFLLMMLAVPTAIGVAIALAVDAGEPEARRLLPVYTGTAAVLVSLLIAVVWQLFDRHIASALQALARQIQTSVHANEALELDQDALRYLGPVGPAASGMLARLQQLAIEGRHSAETAQQRLRQQEQRFAAIVRDLDVGILVVSLEHRIMLFNQCALSALQVPHGIGLSRSVLDFLAPDPLGDAVDRLAAQCARGERDAREHLRLPCRSGIDAQDLRQLTLSIAPVCNTDGDMDGYVLLIEAPADVDKLPARPDFYDFDLFERRLPEAMRQRALHQIDYVVFDTETTGLEPSHGDEMISIAAVRIVNGRLLRGEVFDAYINPGRKIPAASTRFHGITDDDVRDAPNIATVLPRFSRYVGDAVLVAHNAAFDMKFITNKKEQCAVSFDNPVLDTVLLSAWLHDHTTDHTLDALAARFGITITERHTAMGDTLATARIFLCMLELLRARDITTLQHALEVSDEASAIKRAQRQY